jgi:hypothetical protein
VAVGSRPRRPPPRAAARAALALALRGALLRAADRLVPPEAAGQVARAAIASEGSVLAGLFDLALGRVVPGDFTSP